MSAKAAAQKALKVIDWDQIGKLVRSEAGKRELGLLRRQYDDITSSIDSKLNQKVVNIDFEFYKQRLGPGIVEVFEKSYKSLSIPEFQDTLTPEFQKTHAKLVEEAAKEEEFSKKEVERLKAEIQRIKSEKDSLKTLTVDEYFAKHPEVQKKIDNEIREQNWGY